MTAPSSDTSFLRVEDLSVRFRGRDAVVSAVNGVSFTLDRGEVLCLLGESGCGKTVTLRSLLRLLPPRRTDIGGRVLLDGVELSSLSARALDAIRGRQAAMIFQEPMLAFDPVFTIGAQIVELIRRHHGLDRGAARARAFELIEMVQIPSPARCLDAYPHELSGGMCQRAMIALALSGRPSLLLADEPTTALDATVQMQILLLLRRLQRELGMAMIMVTHDVGVAAETAGRIAVMYAGRIVESGPAREVLKRPGHPYTQGLLASIASGLARGSRLAAIPGAPPDLSSLPSGCGFAPRCPQVVDRCLDAAPEMVPLTAQHGARCVLLASRATDEA